MRPATSVTNNVPVIQLQLPVVEGVASKIERILQRCGDRVKQGSVYFDEAGEAAARRIAEADRRPPGGDRGGLAGPPTGVRQGREAAIEALLSRHGAKVTPPISLSLIKK